MSLSRRRLFSLLAVLAILVSLVPLSTMPVKAQASLSVQILSFDRIGIDANNPAGTDPQGNPIGPDKSNIQAKITNNGSVSVTNVVVSFQWTSSNGYVTLSPYETFLRSLGALAPGEQADVFWVVEIARDLNARGTTRSFSIDVTSDQTSATASQTLTVEGLIEQGQDYSNIANVPSTINLGESFLVEAEATVRRNIAYLSFPLQFDRNLFELEQVRLDYYLTSDFSGGVVYTEYDIYYSDPNGIDYKGIRGYYTLHAIRAGNGTFASLQFDSNKNLSSFHYNSTLWSGSAQVVSSNPAASISKSDSPDPVLAGNNITYSITYGNTGNANSTNVVITDSIPANTTYVSGSASGEPGVTIEYFNGSVWSTAEPATVEEIRWLVGTLNARASGQQAGFQVTVNPGTSSGTLIENTATITSDQTSSTEGSVTTVGAPPNPIISKVDSPDPVEHGAVITYTITYGNTGGVAANNAVITDYMPANTSYVSASASGEPGVTIEYFDGAIWSTLEPTTVEAVRWIVGTLGAGVTGQQAGFLVIVDPSASGGSTIQNTATITSDQTPQSAIQVTTVANQPPVATDDAYSVNEDTTLNIPAPGVLGNDSDPDDGTLSTILVSDVSNGTLTLNADGSFSYTPNLNFNGSDSFTYKANDGAADSNIATVTITINPINDPPVAANDSYSVDEDNTLNVPAPGVLGNDSDIDGPSLSAIKVSDPANGSVTLNSDGSFSYTPNLNFNGSDSFTYKANDGAADSNIATVTITVNPLTPPTVTTNAATDVTTDSAALNGDLTSMGTASSIDVTFEWATDDYYTTNVNTYDNESAPPWPMVSTGSFSFALGSLSPGTTYHFRAKAVGDGTAYGADVTFTTRVTLIVNTVGSGSVSKVPDQATYAYNDVVQLTATPAPGWTFSAWSGDITGSVNPENITMDGDKTVTATFTQNQYTLAVNIIGSGSVTKNPDQATYAYNDVVQLTATPAPGWTFSAWSGDLTGSVNPDTITMDGDKTITATFSLITYLVDVSSNPPVGGTVNPGTGQYVGTTVFEAFPNSGYMFVNWTINGVTGETNNPLTLDIQAATTLVANFTVIIPPTVATNAATDVTASTATLSLIRG